MKKGEKFFVNFLSNFVIVILVFAIGFACFMPLKITEIQTVNSEYNGTIYAGDKNSNKVCLMINVYWGTDSLLKMLDILEKYEIKTTFFIGGSWAKDNQSVLKQIYNSGHEIASHGYNHKEHGKLGYTENLSEIQSCHAIVKEILNIDMELFAPPGGSYNSNTTQAASFLGYKTIMWTRDTIDWRDHNSSLIYNRAVTNMCGGDLILMHPTENTVEALTNIICYAKKHNFELTTVSKTLSL